MRQQCVRVGLLALAVATILAAATTASAQTVVLRGVLDGSQENPPVSTGAFGTVTVTVDLATRAIRVQGSIFNLGSGLTAAHIHVGPRGVNGPIVVNFPVTPNVSNDFGFDFTVNAADFIPRGAEGIRSPEDLLQSMLAGTTYVNFHTAVHGPGEIRAQLCPESAAANVLTGIAVCTFP